MLSQIVQLGGALAILGAFAAAQARIVDVRSRSYLWLNLLGALTLALTAWYERQWGFLLLNGVWTIVSAWGLTARYRARRAAPLQVPPT